jgi:hypothetical protein
MAIYGKQIKSASIDLDRLSNGIVASTLGTNHSTLPTSKAVKDYVDAQVTAQDLDLAADSGTGAVDLDTQSLTITGGDGIDSSASGQTVTLAIDSTVATLAGAQELTNKTLDAVTLNTSVSGTAILDEDDMVSDSATKLATQQSIKAYVDAQVGSSGSMSSFDFSDGTNSNTISNGNTLTFVGASNEIEVTASTISDQVTIGLPDDVIIGGTLTVTGNLTVNGTTTTVDTANLTVEDHNIDLGSVANPSNNTANGGGITLKGGADNDKRFYWTTATGAWISSEHISVAVDHDYKIGTTSVLTSNGALKVQSNVAGSGLAHTPSTGALSVDLTQLTDVAVNVASDSIAIIDNSDGNASKKESIADLVDAMAGDGISATNGVLATTRDIEIITGKSGTQPTVKTLSAANIATTDLINLIELRVNGLSYPQGASSTDKEWYIDTNTRDLKWNDNSFSLEVDDEIELITYS